MTDCLPWNPDAAVQQVLTDAREDARDRESGTINFHVARVPGSELLGARWSLARFERYRMRLVGAGVKTPEHPEPEGKLYKPNAEDIATIAGTYVAPHVGHIRVGDEWAKVGPTGLCKIVRNVDFAAVMDHRLAKLMAAEPTRQQHGECLHKVELTTDVSDVTVIRKVGESQLAWAELPEAKQGPFLAWTEFLSRCSDLKVVLAWLHTLTIDGYRGRQSLYLKGDGNDGKSTIAELLLDVLGSAGTIVDKATGEGRFDWANIRELTRLVVLDDVKNPNLLLYAKRVRQLCSGGHFEVERKGVDPIAVNLRSRVLICSNIQLKYDSDAEKTRVLQVDVENGTKLSDPTWKPRLFEELPAILYAAKICFDELAQGHTIVPKSEASAAVAKQGEAAVEEEFEVLLSQLSVRAGQVRPHRDPQGHGPVVQARR